MATTPHPPPPATAPTIIDLKTSFLNHQILLLSQPLSTTTTSTIPTTSLPTKAVNDALFKLNTEVKRHSRLAYPPQGVRHVAEQIGGLYWGGGGVGSGGGGRGRGGGRGVDGEDWEDWVERGVDFRKPEIISQLPNSWTRSETTTPELASQFSLLSRKLKILDTKRKEATEKLERYKSLKSLLEPLSEENALQDNLVTRNGDMESELERCRRLMLRVERGVGGLSDRDEGGDEGEEMIDVEDEEGGERALAVLEGGRR